MIRVQSQAFDMAAEIAALKTDHHNIGGTAVFVGSVREMNEGREVTTLHLEHYPGMTEKALAEIEQQAHQRWPLEASLIVHRYGTLAVGEDIVLVICCSAHREAAFEACAFLMDWLKTSAPFWKLETGDKGATWVEAKASDDAAAQRWTKD
jgi:molybdopterin synthase catalytic subunit